MLNRGGACPRKILQAIALNEVMLSPDVMLQREVEYGLARGAALGQLSAPRDQMHVRAIDEGNAFT